MAEQKQNLLKYTGLDYNSLKQQLNTLLRGDSRFENFVDSALYKMMTNMFLASTDLTNYYIERTAEESFLETAQHLSSVILNANQIGYIVRRPLPAEAEVSITLTKGTYTEGDILVIPSNTKLGFNGNSFITKYGYTYTLTADDVLTLNSGNLTFNRAIPDGSDSLSEEPIVVIQGEKVVYNIEPQNKSGQKWQKYNITDPSFSNLYSYNDLGSGEIGSDRNLTKVFVVNSSDPNSEGVEYHINSRSLTAEDYTVQKINSLANSGDNETQIDVCLMKTNKDTTVDLYFGDGISTSLGPLENQFIRVEYFKTKGFQGNQNGIIANNLSNNGAISLNGNNINDSINFSFASNLRGGADIEDKESIAINAPKIFQALDRLVTKTDYETYINTIENPLSVKYTSVWGEAEEAARQGVFAIPSLMNAVIISSLGSIYKYNSESQTYLPKNIILNEPDVRFQPEEGDLNTSIIEGAANYNAFSQQTYFDLYVKNSSLDYLNTVWSSNSEIANIKTFLKQVVDKSQATVKTYYIPPIIQSFNIEGDVTLQPFSDPISVKQRVENEIYRLLNIETRYNTKINLSRIYEIITSFAEVVSCTIKFKSNDSTYTNESFESFFAAGNYSDYNKNLLQTVSSSVLSDYLSKDINDPEQTEIFNEIVINADTNGDSITDTVTYLDSEKLISGISERTFYSDFAQVLYNHPDLQNVFKTDGSERYLDSDDFKNFLLNTNKTIKRLIRQSMINKDGDISNYSFPNEIVQLRSDLTFKY